MLGVVGLEHGLGQEWGVAEQLDRQAALGCLDGSAEYLGQAHQLVPRDRLIE